MKRFLTAVLAVLLICAFVSCSGGDTGVTETTSAVSESSAETAEEQELSDNLPELDFGGAKLSVFCTDYEGTLAFSNMYTEAENGDVVNDALYARNMAVIERLNIAPEWEEFDFYYADREKMFNRIRAIVMSGDGSADIIFMPTYFISTLMLEGLLVDLNTLPYVEYDMPWWFSDYISNATINGKTFMAAGDGVLPYITGIFCLAFNRSMEDDFNLGNLYDVVNAGEWTFDRLDSVLKGIYSDLNGDGKCDSGDRYGIELIGGNYLSGFEGAAEGYCIRRNKDGSYEYTFGNERDTAIYDRAFSVIHESGACFFGANNAYPRAETPFVAGRALFTGITFNDTVYFRDLPFNYGVIPYPKFDEAQELYHSRTSTGTVVFTAPVTVTANAEMAGAFMEAMSSEGYKTLTPAYFEVALKIKYASDTETAEMLELIKSTADMDIGIMFASSLGSPTDKFKNTLSNPKNSGVWASTAESIREATMNKLDALVAAVG